MHKMVTADDLERSVALLKAMGASRILLFGSALRTPEKARDIDLACAGIAPERFIYAGGALAEVTGKLVDLVDLSRSDRIVRHIERYGSVLYERK